MTCLQATVVCTSMVHIDGATGVHAGRVNGYYEPTQEMVGHASVYRKLGDADVWIEYMESSGQWLLKRTAVRGIDTGWAHAIISPPRPLEECPLSCWQVAGDGTSWVNQSALTVSATTMAAFEMFEAAKVI